MSEQDGTQTSTKQRKSRKTNTSNQQNGKQASAEQRPADDELEAWKAYWKERGQPWRTEPEISPVRQAELQKRRATVPNLQEGIYPFRKMKLERADVEWLLATHEDGCGPIRWSDEIREERPGLDMRGADLRQADLRSLPLTRLRGGLTCEETWRTTEEQRMAAMVLLEKANLFRAQLEKANLGGAQLQGADLGWAQLQGAYLCLAQLQGANLGWAQLQGANLGFTQLQGTNLRQAELNGVNLEEATLSDEEYGSVQLADVKWNNNNLAVIDWTPVKRLGEEHKAHHTKEIADYRAAVRANRQLAVVLRDQGLNEEADHFAYRAQLLQRVVWRKQRRILKYAFSWFLYLIAGYGYRPIRSVIWYLIIIFGFAIAYFTIGHLPPVPDALVFSLTSFHGRGFFPGLGNETSLHNPLVVLAAIEAVVGLFIEISFIATFTQRFFGK